MTKRFEPIPFAGIVEVDDEPEVADKKLFVKTQQEVADELKVSRGTVSHVERKAMKKFKEKFIAKFNKDDYI
jgi:DNA-directed RNA polymerase sigma subunit (sigma70/sigma32)